jgi:hypothetical protein
VIDPYTESGYCWYEQGPSDEIREQVDKARAASLIGTVQRLEDLQREVHDQNLWNAQLYSNRELAHFDWGHGTYYRASLAPLSMLGENLVLQVVDTMVTQVGKNRPKVSPTTHGGSFKLKLQAQRLDRWLYGEFVRLRVYQKMKQVFRDACIFGFGTALVHLDNGKLCVERVFPDEVIVDQHEAAMLGGHPRHRYRRRALPLEQVAAAYGVDPDEIRATNSSDYTSYRGPADTHVVVVEAWRAATPDESGHYMAACEGRILKEESWPHEWLPWVDFHYQETASGFYCPSAVEIALPYQIRLNEINEVIRDAQDVMARPRLLVAEGSRVNPHEIDNLVARVIRYAGIKPEPAVWPAIPVELYNERDRVVRTCFEQFGLGQLVVQSKLPGQARLDSSAALREATAISEDRLADLAQRYEEAFLRLGETMMRVMGAYGGKGYKTTWTTGGKARREVIDWSECDLDENAYTLTLEASSVFSMTPSARRDTLEEWLASGKITPEEYRRLNAHPDLEGETSIQAAAAEDIDRVIELLEDGKYESPTEEQDLVQGVQRVTQAALRIRKYEEYERGDLQTQENNMIKWLSMARAILEKGTEPPPQAPAPPMGPPGPMDQMGMAPPMPMGPPMGGPPMPMGPPGPPMVA